MSPKRKRGIPQRTSLALRAQNRRANLCNAGPRLLLVLSNKNLTSMVGKPQFRVEFPGRAVSFGSGSTCVDQG